MIAYIARFENRTIYKRLGYLIETLGTASAPANFRFNPRSAFETLRLAAHGGFYQLLIASKFVQ
jgi:hypothetical protein